MTTRCAGAVIGQGLGEALQGGRAAKTLKLKGGKIIVTDGPYAETKEQLGGFGAIEARDLDQAVELMSNHPGIRLGPIEIRPIDGELTERCQPKPDDSNPQAEGLKWTLLTGPETLFLKWEGERPARPLQKVSRGRTGWSQVVYICAHPAVLWSRPEPSSAHFFHRLLPASQYTSFGVRYSKA